MTGQPTADEAKLPHLFSSRFSQADFSFLLRGIPPPTPFRGGGAGGGWCGYWRPPPPRATYSPQVNKDLIAGFIKGNQWLIREISATTMAFHISLNKALLVDQPLLLIQEGKKSPFSRSFPSKSWL